MKRTSGIKRTKKGGKPIKKTYKRDKGGKGSGKGGALYKASHAERAYKLALLGLTDVEMATAFGVCEATIHNWKNRFPEFKDMLNKGKTEADAEVATSMYQAAKGYSHPDTKFVRIGKKGVRSIPVTKHYPPDGNLAKFWMKNRTRNNANQWKDITGQELSGPGGTPIDLNTQIDISGMSPEEVLKLVQLGLKIDNNQQKNE